MDDSKKLPVVLNFHNRDIVMAISTPKNKDLSRILSLDILVGDCNETLDKAQINEEGFNPDLRIIFTAVEQIDIMIQGLNHMKTAMKERNNEVTSKEDMVDAILHLIEDLSNDPAYNDLKEKIRKENTTH